MNILHNLIQKLWSFLALFRSILIHSKNVDLFHAAIMLFAEMLCKFAVLDIILADSFQRVDKAIELLISV
jgi:hypothetical protein